MRSSKIGGRGYIRVVSVRYSSRPEGFRKFLQTKSLEKMVEGQGNMQRITFLFSFLRGDWKTFKKQKTSILFITMHWSEWCEDMTWSGMRVVVDVNFELWLQEHYESWRYSLTLDGRYCSSCTITSDKMKSGKDPQVCIGTHFALIE